MPKVADHRTPAEKDCDRILYSSAYRRLAGVTQVVAVGEIQLFHNRLTHTMKVAQLARRLADDLLRGGHATAEELDGAAAEAAALAHDLGHPPFGHIGERALSELCDANGIDGFEGNAQTFRIVTKLARRNSDEPGLGLSPRTLNGILKYPWLRGPAPTPGDVAEKHRHTKWGAYVSEKEAFEAARAGDASGDQSLEAAVMDWCDDISYALHDVEDFFRAGLIPLDRLHEDGNERQDFLAKASKELGRRPGYDPEEGQAAFKGMIEYLPDTPYRGTLEDRRDLHQKTNYFIASYFEAASVTQGRLHIKQRQRHEVMLLKQLTWQYVVNNPALATVQRGQVEMVKALFGHLMDWVVHEEKKESLHRLPTRLRRIYEEIRDDPAAVASLPGPDGLRVRAVVDYIAALTEDQAIDMHSRLHGGLASKSILEGWVRW